MAHHCIALFSGGLDSLLAIRIMAIQGIAVTALHSVNCFHGTKSMEDKKESLRRDALAVGARDIVFPDITDAVVALTQKPRHGYGKYFNACIDCRLRTLEVGFAHMRAVGADFVVSGEVIGQRPMSQRRDAMRLTDRMVADWGYAGLLLRPLSARLLAATIPVAKGWVDENLLCAVSGRGRETQMRLATELGIGNYPAPAGGCLLTDREFSHRLAVLMRCKPHWEAADVELLKVGRHFQISPQTRVIASRNEEENHRLRELANPNDRFYINAERNGAAVLLRGPKPPAAEAAAAGLAVHYSKMRERGQAEVRSWRIEKNTDIDFDTFTAEAVDPDSLREMERGVIGPNCLKEMRKQILR